MNKEDVLHYIQKAVQEALEMFGTYTFGDKGPQEVMDVDDCYAKVSALSENDKVWVIEKLKDGTHYEFILGDDMEMDLL